MGTEQRAFVFSVTFIVVFSGLLISLPIDFQGAGATPEFLIPLNPNLLTDFAETKDFVKTDFTDYGPLGLFYQYDLPTGGTTFDCNFYSSAFYVGAHTLFLGVWLGGYNWVNFISENGTNYGTSVTFDDIDNDAEDGAVRYTLQYEDTGNSAGGFVFYWNTTTYSDSQTAWNADGLYCIHGIGLSTDTNIASLLLSLLFLQIPEVPFLVNLLLVTPIWANIIYVAWYLITSMIPLISGP